MVLVKAKDREVVLLFLKELKRKGRNTLGWLVFLRLSGRLDIGKMFINTIVF